MDDGRFSTGYLGSQTGCTGIGFGLGFSKERNWLTDFTFSAFQVLDWISFLDDIGFSGYSFSGYRIVHLSINFWYKCIRRRDAAQLHNCSTFLYCIYLCWIPELRKSTTFCDSGSTMQKNSSFRIAVSPIFYTCLPEIAEKNFYTVNTNQAFFKTSDIRLT